MWFQDAILSKSSANPDGVLLWDQQNYYLMSLITPNLYEENTVQCRHNVIQYCKIFHKWLQKVKQNINQMLDPQKTWASYGVSFVNICEKTDRVITALHLYVQICMVW